MRRVRSSHILEYLCTHSIDYLWLVEGRTIDYSTICKFRVRFRKPLKSLFRQVVHVGLRMGLVTLVKVAFDGTRVKANAVVSEEAFAQARQRMPRAFWAALLVVLGERFGQQHGRVLRWHAFRLLAMDGTTISLPNRKTLRDYFGCAKNGKGWRTQTRMVMLQFPPARLPFRYEADHAGRRRTGRCRPLASIALPQRSGPDGPGVLEHSALLANRRSGGLFCDPQASRNHLSRIEDRSMARPRTTARFRRPHKLQSQHR